MESLPAWGPTIVCVAGWIFFGGILWNRVQNARDGIQELKIDHAETRKELQAATNEIVGLKAFKEGYSAGKAAYSANHS